MRVEGVDECYYYYVITGMSGPLFWDFLGTLNRSLANLATKLCLISSLRRIEWFIETIMQMKAHSKSLKGGQVVPIITLVLYIIRVRN